MGMVAVKRGVFQSSSSPPCPSSSVLRTQSLSAPVLQGTTRVHHPHRGQAGEEGVREGGQPARAALGADLHRPRHRAGACFALSAPRDSPAERTQVLPYLFDHPVERVTDTVFEVGLPPRKPCDSAYALIVGRREGRRGGGAQEGAVRRVYCCILSLEVDVLSVMRDLPSRSRAFEAARAMRVYNMMPERVHGLGAAPTPRPRRTWPACPSIVSVRAQGGGQHDATRTRQAGGHARPCSSGPRRW
jgi:hypothetical protein